MGAFPVNLPDHRRRGFVALVLLLELLDLAGAAFREAANVSTRSSRFRRSRTTTSKRSAAALPASARPGCRVSSACISPGGPASRPGPTIPSPGRRNHTERSGTLRGGDFGSFAARLRGLVTKKVTPSHGSFRRHKEGYVVTKNLTLSQRSRRRHKERYVVTASLDVVTKTATSSQRR